MQRHPILAASALALALAVTAASSGPALAAPPSLAACARSRSPDNPDLERKRPLAIPAALRAIVQSDLRHYAIATLNGGTVCVDASWMEQAAWDSNDPAARFVSFTWGGMEAGGYYVIDRMGRGQAIDTGAKPLFSPSRGKFAAIEISESGFGSLNGFVVWQVDAGGIRRLAFLDNLPRMSDWRIDGWAGEACLNLSSIPMDKYPENAADLRKVARTRFIARPGAKAWSVARAPAGCPRA